MDEFLTVEEVAALLKISAFKVREYARQGKLPGRKVGKAWRFKRDDIYKWFNGKEGKE
jgi:excisionase family DNA binding protein